MTQSCESCKFFVQTNAKQGVCRRYPPHPLPTGPDKVTAFWAPTRTTDFCGEWKQKVYLGTDLPDFNTLRRKTDA